MFSEKKGLAFLFKCE